MSELREKYCEKINQLYPLTLKGNERANLIDEILSNQSFSKKSEGLEFLFQKLLCKNSSDYQTLKKLCSLLTPINRTLQFFCLQSISKSIILTPVQKRELSIFYIERVCLFPWELNTGKEFKPYAGINLAKIGKLIELDVSEELYQMYKHINFNLMSIVSFHLSEDTRIKFL